MRAPRCKYRGAGFRSRLCIRHGTGCVQKVCNDVSPTMFTHRVVCRERFAGHRAPNAFRGLCPLEALCRREETRIEARQGF